MPIVYKVLGQSAPTSGSFTDLYAVPTGSSAICSTLTVANRGLSTFYRIAVRPTGSALADRHYIVFDGIVDQYSSVLLTLGITLNSTDVVTVRANTSDLSFGLFGSENT
jgi:hypothetical protein